MADRYWVGGNGTWDATTTHWSASSGGAAGASVPTATDNVIFDTLSNLPTNASYAVTIGTASSCLDISISGPAANTVTITSAATAVINVYGSWLNAATGVAFTTVGNNVINFSSTTTGRTIATNNNLGLASTNIIFNGVGGGWTLTTALTANGVFPNAGTFDTNSLGLAINSFQRSGSLAAVLTLGNSAIVCSGSGPIGLNSTNFVLNAGTSTINCSNASITFTGAGLTFYNVLFSSTSAAINTVSITGANTFNNLNVATTTLQKIIQLGANQTVNGTLTLGATNTAQFRISVVSDIVGTPRTLTVATLATLTDVDFRDIVAAGTSSPWSGTRIGNCLGNSNITFTAAATKYWNLPAGGNWTDTAWALTSGGAAAVINFPLAQDSVVIENTGLNLSASITMNTNADIGPLDMSTRSLAFTLALNNADPKFYGNVFLSFALTLTGNTAGSPTFSFYGQGKDSNLAVLGVTLPLQQFIINCPNGSLILQNTTRVELVAATTGVTTLTSGTFNINENSFSTVNFASNSNTTTRTLSLSNGVINITGGNLTAWNTTSSVGLTYTSPISVNFTYAGSTGTRTISASNTSYINANITAGTDTITNVGGGAFGSLNFTGFSGTLANASRGIYGNLTLASGMTLTSGVNATTFDGTDNRTITSGTQTFTNLLLQSESFSLTPWVNQNTTVTANAIISPDGTLDGDKLVEDTTTLTHLCLQNFTPVNATTYTLSVFLKAAERNFAFVGFNAGSLATTFVSVNLSLGTVSTATGTPLASSIQSVGSGWYRVQITLASTGVANSQSDIRVSTDGVWANRIYTGNGTSGIYLWGAQLEINGTATTYIPTTTTTASITGNRIMDFPVTFNNSGTTDCLDALTLGSTRALTITSGTLNLAAGTTSTVGSFVTTGTTPKFLGSTTPGTQATISDASGTNTVTYLSIKDSNATGGAVWNALANTIVNAGNNTGWLIYNFQSTYGWFPAVGPQYVNQYGVTSSKYGVIQDPYFSL